MTRTAVLLHGFLGGPWSFDTIVTELAAIRRWLRPTLSYHGSAPIGQPPIIDFFGEIDRLATHIRTSSPTPVDLVGYSMGGRLALGLAVRYPDLVRNLVLISSRRGLDDPNEREARRIADEHWARRLETEDIDDFLAAWWAQPLFVSLSRLPPAVLSLERSRRNLHDAGRLANALRQFSLGLQPSYAAELRHLTMPVTLLAGELDVKFAALARQLAAELPRGRCHLVGGAGHHLLLEAPSSTAEVIREVVER